MVSIASLWLPILLSAVAVFIASSIIHMLLPYHRNNMAQVPNEDKFRDSHRELEILPGEYMFPHACSAKDMETEEYNKKLSEGPVGILVQLPNEPWPMGKSLIQWFIYSLLMGVFAGYIAVNSLQVGANYLEVMQMAGAAAFGGYALGHFQNSIWWFRAWSTTFKFIFDGLVYALLTGGVFGWLWPAA